MTDTDTSSNRVPAPPNPGHWTYLPAAGQVMGNMETGYDIYYSRLAPANPDRAAAIAAGFEAYGCDDFNIVTLDGNVAVAHGWMDEDFADDADGLADIATQLGYEVLAEAATTHTEQEH